MEAKDMILICKALSDTNRLEIVRMLSDGEKCGCKILDKFNITQPTLSHHMKILVCKQAANAVFTEAGNSEADHLAAASDGGSTGSRT